MPEMRDMSARPGSCVSHHDTEIDAGTHSHEKVYTSTQVGETYCENNNARALICVETGCKIAGTPWPSVNAGGQHPQSSGAS